MKKLGLVALSLAAVAVVSAIIVLSGQAQDATEARIRAVTTHVSEVPPDEISARAEDLLTWVLDIGHAAAEEDDAAARAAQVGRIARGEALRALDGGLLGTSGLETYPETFHETTILAHEIVTDGPPLRISAIWRPVGLVADGGHRHRLGAAFTGTLAFEQVDGIWQLVALEVDAVDTDGAGEIVEATPDG